LSAKYFRQFQKKEILLKLKALIQEGIKAKDILDRILEGEMTVTPKELWAIALMGIKGNLVLKQG